MVQVAHVIEYVEEHVGHPLAGSEGVHHGSVDADVRTVLTCWMPTEGALNRAGQLGADLVIGHESLYYPYDAAVRDVNPPGWEDWPVNRQRRDLLDRYGLTFLRLHGVLDQICVFDDFRRQLGLPGAAAASGWGHFARRFDIEPCTVGELVDRVKRATGMTHVRVSAPRGMDQQVSRVGLPWGGHGLFVNVSGQAQMVALGCDVLIAGEADDYGFRFARDQGIPMIETSHEVSENAGLRRFTQMLAYRFGELTVEFYENRCPWQWA